MANRLRPGVVFFLVAIFATLAFLRWQDRSAASSDAEDFVLVGTVTKIVDGDTADVELDSGPIRVRLQGIDAPERGQPLSGDATALIRELIDGREVELLPAEQTSYDRMVARIFVDGTDVNAEIIKRGLAMAERRFLHEFEDGEMYCVFEHDARTKNLGIWQLPADQRVAPWEWRGRKNRTKPFTDYGNTTAEECIAAIRP